MGSLYGYEVATDLPLQRLNPARGERGRIHLDRGPAALLERCGELTAWQGWPDADGQDFAVARTAAGLVTWSSVTGGFDIDPDALRIRVMTPRFDNAWEHELAATAVPLLLAERHDLPLHASAVAIDGQAVLFCGPTGRGKSTLALTAARLGHVVMTEDGAVLDFTSSDAVIWPGALGIRAGEDVIAADGARAGDAAISPGQRSSRRLQTLPRELQANGPAPVAAVCHLGQRQAELKVARLSPAQAIPALAPSLIHAGGAASLRPAFALLARLVEQVSVYRVTMPDDLSRIREAARRVLSHAAG
jgi:energy-coupling factor transporter ATP-binding protein EcfA2